VSVRAVFFDAGHTLLYPDPPVCEVYAREAAAFGARGVDAARLTPLFHEEFQAFMRGYVMPEASDEQDRAMWRAITGRLYGRVPEFACFPFEPWFERLHDIFGHASLWRLYEDVRPALASLRARGVRLGIISNWDRRLRTIVREMELDSLFDAVTISSEEGVRKPNPRIFERALARLGVAPHEAMHVGDLVCDDVEGARAAGVRPVLLDRDDRHRPPPDGVPVVRDLRDLPLA
jgi:putative hydrolase of the HAD superfamily